MKIMKKIKTKNSIKTLFIVAALALFALVCKILIGCATFNIGKDAVEIDGDMIEGTKYQNSQLSKLEKENSDADAKLLREARR